MQTENSWRPCGNRPGCAQDVLENQSPPRIGEDQALAFTRIELLVVLGALALLTLLAVPVLANGKAGSQRAVCASNLARIGQALALWGAERGDLYPWQVQASLGGT